MKTNPPSVDTHPAHGISEHEEYGLTILSPIGVKPRRRILYVNSYGGRCHWNEIKHGMVAPHHLWGSLELVRLGYEVGLAEPLPDFYLHRNPLPHDLRLLSAVRSWLGRDGIVYCGHNVLYWLPLLRELGAHHCRIVSLLFAREPLDQSRAHSGIIALTPPAAEHARKLAPHARVAHLGWGASLGLFPQLDYAPTSFLSCGRTRRDDVTLVAAANLSQRPFRVVSPLRPSDYTWPANVHLTRGAPGETYTEFLRDQYGECAASLIILSPDPLQRTAVGMTNLIEALAMGRPVIVTRTGAIPDELDVEKAGCGVHVPASDPQALVRAIEQIATDPRGAAEMGANGRTVCERRYNMGRFTSDLHEFFESL
jgi:glycosyltransferase involved in cell wall biosynthesis